MKEKTMEELKKELKDSQSVFNSFFNQSTAGAFFMMLDEPVVWNDSVDKSKVMDYVFEHHRITKINKAMLSQYKTTEKDFIGLTPRDLFVHDLEYGYRIWTEFFDNGKLHIDTDERRRDGSQLWIRGDYECLYDSQGRITGHYGLQIDITESKLAEDSLKKSQLLLSSAMDSQKDTIIFSIDKYYTYLTFNKAHSDAMKNTWNVDINSEMNILDCITSDDERLLAKTNYDRALNGESHSTVQIYGKVNPVYYESFFNPIINDSNEIIGCTGLARNITDRMKADEALRHSFVFSETLLKTIPFGMDIVDETGTILFQSDSFKKLFGESAIGGKCWELYRDDKKQCSDCPLIEGIIIGETEAYESNGVLGNRVFDISHTGMMYQGKKAMLEIFQDITERKQADEKLQMNESYLKETQAIANLGTYSMDVASGIWTSSEILDKIFGIDSDYDKSVESWASVIHPEWQKIMTDYFINEVIGNKTKFNKEYKIIRKNDKSVRWVHGIGNLKFNGNNQPVTMIGTIQDITERKQNELELIKAKEKAEESDRLKSAFLSNMSHEIRTPMNGILGFTELLKEPNLSTDDQQDFIQTIQISGERMLNTINNIVDVSKIEAGLTTVFIDETNINKKIEFTYKFFKPEVERKGLQFICKNGLPTKDAVIRTDNEKVYGVLTNLIKNAIKFTYDGSIEFGYVKKGAFLEFYVKDTGVGIPKNLHQTIFERFRQGSHDLNRLFEGSGLGLSISKSYIEMLGGKIWVESEEGRGSTFYFTIPYHSVEEEKTEIKNVVSAELKEVQMKNLKILIVEDDEVSYSLLKRTIQKIGKEVLHAITGVQAIEVCRNNPDLDLALMDIRMPVMDGLEATRQIRQFNKDVIIIAQTAHAFSGDKEKAIEAGCNDYISKPINMTELFELIKKHVNN